MSGRIVLHLDQGLGWTGPVFVAGCGDCGTELARSTDQAAAERTARRTRCPVCGTRTARRLPGTTSPATDLAVGYAARRRRGAGPPRPLRLLHRKEVSSPCPPLRPWLTDQRGRGPAARTAQDRHPLGQRGPPGAPAHPRRPPPLRPRADRPLVQALTYRP